MFRYWDGSAWSAALSPTPNAAPPSQGLVPGAASPGSQPLGRQGGVPGQHQGHGQQQGHGQHGGYPGQPQTRRAGKGWLVALVAVGLVVVVLVALGIRAVSQVAGGGTGGGGNPGGQPTQQICPEESQVSASPEQRPADGRVYGGALSYPVLPPPWEAPAGDNRVPFGRDVMSQVADVEPYPQGRWVASVLVGELIAGDGFFTPEQGAEIVVECVVGVFYGENTQVERDDQVSEATTLDGKDAWLVESHLTFDIPDLETKGETLILMIVATGDATASLFYASIPDTSPQFMQPARDALAELRVEE
ncbi:Protein of unknown function [Auraticoccus monumenti]|uniref:Uncharacterized protein n=2 Tax=Auraticoccus monumenti TaxID=675864 RepID=A0A1G7F2Z8_9ACTN|nr:Protein of unknown function [Auraticoccus monumenti]